MATEHQLQLAADTVEDEWDGVATDYLAAMGTVKVPASEVATFCLDRLGQQDPNIYSLLQEYSFESLRDMVSGKMSHEYYGY